MQVEFSYKSLSDKHAMYIDLKDQILAAEEITDLLPFLKTLSTLNDLKTQLISLLDKQYNAEKEETKQNTLTNKSPIRSLFVSLYSFNGIPSDVMHANIISFLPSSSLEKLPLVSKYFRTIMLRHPFIYNCQRYKVKLQSTWMCKLCTFSNNSQTQKCQMCDQNRGITPSLIFDHCYKTIIITKPIENNQIPDAMNINCIERWDLQSEPIGFGNVVSNASSHIQKLELNSFSAIMFTENSANSDNINFKEQCKFTQCIILRLNHKDPQIGPLLQRKDVFSKLQCLELTIDQTQNDSSPDNIFDHYRSSDQGYLSDSFYDNINETLSHLSATLKCLKLRFNLPISFDNMSAEAPQIRFSKCKILKIPENIEWLRLVNIKNCRVDVSKCNQLIGVHLIRGLKNENMIWPKYNTYIIPFLYGDEASDYAKNKYKPHVMYVAFASEQSWSVEISKLKLHKTDHAIGKMNKGELIFDIAELFLMLMKYKFTDPMVREEKILQVKKWWSLQSAMWVKTVK